MIGLEAELPLRHLNRDLEEVVEGIRGVLPLAGILERGFAEYLVDAFVLQIRRRRHDGLSINHLDPRLEFGSGIFRSLAASV